MQSVSNKIHEKKNQTVLGVILLICRHKDEHLVELRRSSWNSFTMVLNEGAPGWFSFSMKIAIIATTIHSPRNVGAPHFYLYERTFYVCQLRWDCTRASGEGKIPKCLLPFLSNRGHWGCTGAGKTKASVFTRWNRLQKEVVCRCHGCQRDLGSLGRSSCGQLLKPFLSNH